MLPGRSIAEAGDGFEVGSAAFAVVGGLERRVDIRVQRSGCAVRKHPDYGVGLTFEQNVLPDDVGSGREGIAPQGVADDDGPRSVRTVFDAREIASDEGVDSEHVEVVLRDASGMDVLDV